MDSHVVQAMKASIDIGTNTTLLLVAEESESGLQVVHEEQRMTRLGQGVDESKTLHHDSILRVVGAIREYQRIISEEFGLTTAIVTATSAVRDAQNRHHFIDWVKKETGLSVQVLSGHEEAKCTYLGATSVLDSLDSSSNSLVLDIGGGSTEIILAKAGKIEDAFSFDIGCVRFTERYLKNDPPAKTEIARCQDEIDHQFSKRKFLYKGKLQAIGVAGTLTSLAAIDLGVQQFDKESIDNHTITLDSLSQTIDAFSTRTHSQLLELYPGILKGREDVFFAGLLILRSFMKLYNVMEIKVSTGGVRHGALLGEMK